MNKKTIQVGHNQIRAQLSKPNEADRTVEVTWSTGAKGLRSDPNIGQYYEELEMTPAAVDMSRLNTGAAPVLASHDQSLDSVIGVVERAWLEGGMGKAMVRFADDPKSDVIWQKVKSRIIRNLSVGYSVQKYTDVSKKGDSIPTMLATRFTPSELSIVAVPFDMNAVTRNQNNELTEVEIIASEKGQSMSNEQETTLKERSRVTEITRAVNAAKLGTEFATDLIERGVSTAEASKEIFRKMEESQRTPNISSVNTSVSVGESSQDKQRSVLVDHIATRLEPSIKPTQDTRIFAGQSLARNMETYLGRKLGETDGALIKRALSTSDFPFILSASAEKAAQARYSIAPRSFKVWTSGDTLRNYKAASRVRAGDSASLLAVNEAGEIQQSSFGEQHETVSLQRYGRIVSLSHKALVNDDLGLLQAVANETGTSSARLENQLAYQALISNPTMGDSIALFHASHGNLGTPGAPSVTTLSEMLKFMRKQMSVDGLDPLNLSPKYLICGPDTEVACRQLLAAISPQQSSNVNIFNSIGLELVVDSQIQGNGYYMAADPAIIRTVVVYGMESSPGPTVMTKLDFASDNLQVKTSFDCAAAPLDWRGLCYNAGN
jgi:hypothetical protein